MTAPTPDTLEQTLEEIQHVLAEEHEALRKLDSAAITEAAARKSALEERLRTFSGKVADTPATREALDRIRRSAQLNHALLMHARSCLKSAIELATGQERTEVTYGRGVNASSAPLRVNIKG